MYQVGWLASAKKTGTAVPVAVALAVYMCAWFLTEREASTSVS